MNVGEHPVTVSSGAVLALPPWGEWGVPTVTAEMTNSRVLTNVTGSGTTSILDDDVDVDVVIGDDDEDGEDEDDYDDYEGDKSQDTGYVSDVEGAWDSALTDSDVVISGSGSDSATDSDSNDNMLARPDDIQSNFASSSELKARYSTRRRVSSSRAADSEDEDEDWLPPPSKPTAGSSQTVSRSYSHRHSTVMATATGELTSLPETKDTGVNSESSFSSDSYSDSGADSSSDTDSESGPDYRDDDRGQPANEIAANGDNSEYSSVSGDSDYDNNNSMSENSDEVDTSDIDALYSDFDSDDIAVSDTDAHPNETAQERAARRRRAHYKSKAAMAVADRMERAGVRADKARALRKSTMKDSALGRAMKKADELLSGRSEPRREKKPHTPVSRAKPSVVAMNDEIDNADEGAGRESEVGSQVPTSLLRHGGSKGVYETSVPVPLTTVLFPAPLPFGIDRAFLSMPTNADRDVSQANVTAAAQYTSLLPHQHRNRYLWSLLSPAQDPNTNAGMNANLSGTNSDAVCCFEVAVSVPFRAVLPPCFTDSWIADTPKTVDGTGSKWLLTQTTAMCASPLSASSNSHTCSVALDAAAANFHSAAGATAVGASSQSIAVAATPSQQQEVQSHYVYLPYPKSVTTPLATALEPRNPTPSLSSALGLSSEAGITKNDVMTIMTAKSVVSTLNPSNPVPALSAIGDPAAAAGAGAWALCQKSLLDSASKYADSSEYLDALDRALGSVSDALLESVGVAASIVPLYRTGLSTHDGGVSTPLLVLTPISPAASAVSSALLETGGHITKNNSIVVDDDVDDSNSDTDRDSRAPKASGRKNNSVSFRSDLPWAKGQCIVNTPLTAEHPTTLMNIANDDTPVSSKRGFRAKG